MCKHRPCISNAEQRRLDYVIKKKQTEVPEPLELDGKKFLPEFETDRDPGDENDAK